jgi:hypothetical protein
LPLLPYAEILAVAASSQKGIETPTAVIFIFFIKVLRQFCPRRCQPTHWILQYFITPANIPIEQLFPLHHHVFTSAEEVVIIVIIHTAAS